MEENYNLPLRLLSPGNNSTMDDIAPFFDWGNAENITSYHIQVGHTSDFSGTLIADVQTLTASNYHTSTFFNNNQTYYWRVRVKNENEEWLEWSKTWSFTIEGNNELVRLKDTTPLLDWADINTTGYHIQISTKNDFTENIIINDNTLDSLEYQVTGSLDTMWVHRYISF